MCIACHYSIRYNDADHFIKNCCSDSRLTEKTLYVANTDKDRLIDEFIGLNSSSGAVDGFTYFTWGTNGMRDVNMLRPITEEYVKPEVGTLIMFPSWLRHSVNPFFGDGERRTFSANINIMNIVSKNEKTN